MGKSEKDKIVEKYIKEEGFIPVSWYGDEAVKNRQILIGTEEQKWKLEKSFKRFLNTEHKNPKWKVLERLTAGIVGSGLWLVEYKPTGMKMIIDATASGRSFTDNDYHIVAVRR